MNHTFEVVDEKIEEAEFFLRHMANAGSDLMAFKCFFSAYLSAARTATLALQQFKNIPNFETWYGTHRQGLRKNHLAKFFLEARNSHVHGGPYPVSGYQSHLGTTKFTFPKTFGGLSAPTTDIVTACRENFLRLLEVVLDCYVKLGVHFDDQQYYTKEHFMTLSRNIDDAEVEIYGWINESLIEEGFEEDDRWHELRSYVGACKINHLFFSYLGKHTPQPLLPDYLWEIAYTPEDLGWFHVPAGFTSLEEYWNGVIPYMQNQENQRSGEKP
jgi:hypothetical protein